MNENIRQTTGSPAGNVESVLSAVLRSAQELLVGVPSRPSVMRVRAGDVAVELRWQDEQLGTLELAGLPAPAPERTGAGRPAAPGRGDLLHDICAPTVGVFYRSPEPGLPPFVKEGDLVEAGQQVAILEAMKVMIPVESERRGRVFAVAKENGAQVEYGEPLFSIEPTD
jgi:acetyl-CoA carboxylase biotin carboxyl carrier protein